MRGVVRVEVAPRTASRSQDALNRYLRHNSPYGRSATRSHVAPPVYWANYRIRVCFGSGLLCRAVAFAFAGGEGSTTPEWRRLLYQPERVLSEVLLSPDLAPHILAQTAAGQGARLQGDVPRVAPRLGGDAEEARERMLVFRWEAVPTASETKPATMRNRPYPSATTRAGIHVFMCIHAIL